MASLWDDDICLCYDYEECPKKDKCLRAGEHKKPGVYTISRFYDPNNEKCEYFIERKNKNA